MPKALEPKNQSLHLELIRTHLLDLLESKPALGTGENLRSAHALLGRYPGQFNRAFHAALVKGLGEELALLMPKPAAPSKPTHRANDPFDGMSLSLIDIDEVERILLVDRVAQRFSLHYDAALESLTQRLGNLLDRDSTSAGDNPLRRVVLVRAFAQAWDNGELDPQATEDLILLLEPSHGLDLAPLYEALNATLAQASVAAQLPVRIKRSGRIGIGSPWRWPGPIGSFGAHHGRPGPDGVFGCLAGRCALEIHPARVARR